MPKPKAFIPRISLFIKVWTESFESGTPTCLSKFLSAVDHVPFVLFPSASLVPVSYLFTISSPVLIAFPLFLVPFLFHPPLFSVMFQITLHF